jgi:hypothetical protein
MPDAAPIRNATDNKGGGTMDAGSCLDFRPGANDPRERESEELSR